MTERTKYQSFEAVEIHRRDIKGAPYNPRGISPAARSRLKRGVKKHGIVDTLVFNKRTGHIVGGHQRLSVLDELEGTDDYTITVQQIDVDENDEKLLNLALNNQSMQGYFEKDMLQDIFGQLMADGVDIEGAGYTTNDVQLMFPDVFATGVLAEQIEAEEPIVNQLHEMARIGKEYEEKFRKDLDLPPTKEMLTRDQKVSIGTDDPYPADYDAEGGESSWANPAAGGVVYEDVEGDGEPDHGGDDNHGSSQQQNGDGWKHDKDFFKKERQRVVKTNDFATSADHLLTITFQSNNQLLQFLAAFGIPQDKRILDIHDIEGAFGVNFE